jgi:hypothetical protein
MALITGAQEYINPPAAASSALRLERPPPPPPPSRPISSYSSDFFMILGFIQDFKPYFLPCLRQYSPALSTYPTPEQPCTKPINITT